MRKFIIAAALIAGVSTQVYAVTDEDFLSSYHITAADLNSRQGFEKIYSAIKAEIGGYVPTTHCQAGLCLKVWAGRGVVFAEDPTAPEERYWCAISEIQKTSMCLSYRGRLTQNGQTVRNTWPN